MSDGKPPYEKWFMILNRFEAEIKAFFPNAPPDPKKPDAPPTPNPGQRIAQEVSSIRAILRNVMKLDG